MNTISLLLSASLIFAGNLRADENLDALKREIEAVKKRVAALEEENAKLKERIEVDRLVVRKELIVSDTAQAWEKGFEAQQIPVRGAPEAINEVLGQRVDFFFSPTLAAVPLIRDGKLAALAVSGSRRAQSLPEVPTTTEAGYPNSDYNFWIGMWVPVKTPRDVVDRLYQETRKILAIPSVRVKLIALGSEPAEMTPAQFDKFFQDDIALNTQLVKAAGIKPNP